MQKLKNRIENSVSGHEKAKQQLAEVLPEYGRLKERLYEVTRQHGEAKRSVNVSVIMSSYFETLMAQGAGGAGEAEQEPGD